MRIYSCNVAATFCALAWIDAFELLRFWGIPFVVAITSPNPTLSLYKKSPMAEKPHSTGAHILVFPFPAQGHMLPLLDLTHALCLHGLTITIPVTPKNLPFLQPLLSIQPSIQTLVLPFPSHPSIPDGVENVKDIGHQGIFWIMSALTQLYDPLTEWFNSHPSPPVAIISDMFLGWTHHLATQLRIPRIAFYSSGPFMISLINHALPNWDNSVDTCEFPELPNSPVFPVEHLPPEFHKNRATDPNPGIIKSCATANIQSWGAVFNTSYALEGAYLEHFSETVGHGRVWAVGPVSLLNSNCSETIERGEPSSTSAIEVLSWLDDSCSDGSVVYVCFGSQVFLTREQIEALAKGLEESGARFILVVKPETFIPDGFIHRVAGRGFVIKGWAPQVSILNHRAVGGFLTHCGWNSVLEGVAAGVLLFAWPMQADQFVNAKLLVEYLGVAVTVCEGVNTVPDSNKVARFLATSMNEMGVQKVRAMELREQILCAVKGGGSSNKDIDALVKELQSLSL